MREGVAVLRFVEMHGSGGLGVICEVKKDVLF
jgi:hypothetical protein